MGASPVKSVIVIGGGIVGVCCAHYLAQEGCDVTLLDDAQAPGGSASMGNSGMIVPSHFSPLAAPGMPMYGLRMQLQNESPFGFAFPMSAETAAWSRLFLAACSTQRTELAEPALRDLHFASRSLYLELAQSLSFPLNDHGLVSVCLEAGEIDEAKHEIERANTIGVPAEWLDADSLRTKLPASNASAVGAIYFPMDACADPEVAHAALWRSLSGRVQLPPAGKVVELSVANGLARVRIDDGRRYAAGSAVVAAGAWSGTLLRQLGVRAPMVAGKGLSVTVESVGDTPELCALTPSARLAMTPMGGRVRFGGTMEIGAPNFAPKTDRVAGFYRSIELAYPAYAGRRWEAEKLWVGNRPLTPDGLPYVGKLQKSPEIVVAAGHAMAGFSLAPVTGKLVSELVLGRSPSMRLDLLDPLRYA